MDETFLIHQRGWDSDNEILKKTLISIIMLWKMDQVNQSINW